MYPGIRIRALAASPRRESQIDPATYACVQSTVYLVVCRRLDSPSITSLAGHVHSLRFSAMRRTEATIPCIVATLLGNVVGRAMIHTDKWFDASSATPSSGSTVLLRGQVTTKEGRGNLTGDPSHRELRRAEVIVS